MKGFTLVEVLIAMIIVLGSAIFLLKAVMSTQEALIFSKHKQESIFLLEQRIEEIKGMEWATSTPGVKFIKDEHIHWSIGGAFTRNIGPIEFIITPGNLSGTGSAPGRPSIGNGTLDVREDEIFGGTFTASCAWMEGNKWATTTYTLYIALNKTLLEESKNFKEKE
ncbi:MAG: prepilin-type N-terminal cleavage/methylation domain-containing protein [bacterium]